MNKSFPPSPLSVFLALTKIRWLKSIVGISVVLLAGCMATENRWQATQMRQQVMDYYNDQIMENLIRASERLPFVHVDVTSMAATDAAGLTGTIGNGDTTGSTRTGSGLMNGMLTVARTVSHPFAYSVTPARNTSLQIIASPVLGQLSTENEEPPEPTTSPTPPFEQTKVTKITGAKEELEKTLTELTPKPVASPNPKPITIYMLYDNFVSTYKDRAFCHTDDLTPPHDYIPGTKKRWGNEFYYIKDTAEYRLAYYKFCKTLFTKGQAQSVEKAVEAKANQAAQAAEARI